MSEQKTLYDDRTDVEAQWSLAMTRIESNDPKQRLKGLQYLVTHHASDARTMDRVRDGREDADAEVRQYADQQLDYVCKKCSAPYANLSREELLALVRHWYEELIDLLLFADLLGSVSGNDSWRQAEARRKLRCIELILGHDEIQKATEKFDDEIRRSAGIKGWELLTGSPTEEELEEYRATMQQDAYRERGPRGRRHVVGRRAWEAIPIKCRRKLTYFEKWGSCQISGGDGSITFYRDGFFCRGSLEAICPLLEYRVPGSAWKIGQALTKLTGEPISLNDDVVQPEETDGESQP